MINILIWLAIIVLAIFVLRTVFKIVLVLTGLGFMFKEEYDNQKKVRKYRGTK